MRTLKRAQLETFGAAIRRLGLLAGANLADVDLSYVDLSYVDLSYVDLSYVDLSGANLAGANLADAINIPEIPKVADPAAVTDEQQHL